MSLMIDAIREDGQPKEEGWPYLDGVPYSVSVWMPPKIAARCFVAVLRQDSGHREHITQRSMADSRFSLSARITEQFYLPAGRLPYRDAPNDPMSNHALVAVGHGTNGGDALVLVRNSWGETWANLGHAWVTRDSWQSRFRGLAVPLINHEGK